MKYITIELTENYCRVDDFYFDGDMSRMGRELAIYLERKGWPLIDSRVEVLAFGKVDLSVLSYNMTLFRYVNFLGGIHNPGILFLNRDGYFRSGNPKQLIEEYIALRLT